MRINKKLNEKLKYTPYKNEEIKKMVLNKNSHFSIVEAYNAIRTNLLYLPIETSCKKIVITSSLANEGKTIATINIAIAMAMIGKRVLLIDADMRASILHRYLNIEEKSGLSEYLVGLDAKANIISLRADGYPISLLMKGNIPPNPAELLLSNRMENLLKKLENEFDYIFIDTPPVEVVSDATSLLKCVDGYLMIVRSEYSDIEILRESVEKLEHLHAVIYGFILNQVTSTRKNYNNYKRNRYYRPKHMNKFEKIIHSLDT